MNVSDSASQPQSASVTPGAFDESAHDALRAVEDASYWFQHRNRVIAALLRRFPIVGLFADVGGGNGCVAAHLAGEGHDVLVIEPGAGGYRNARARGLRAYPTTLTDSPFAAESLGGIGAFDVVEHIADASGFLSACRERLTRSGRLFITVPAHQWLWSTADIDAGHVKRYTRASLRALVIESGFEVEFDSYLFLSLIPALAAARALPYRLGAHPKAQEHVARDHTPGGVVQRLIERSLRWELARVAAGRTIPSGTSVALVARPRTT